MYDSIPIPICQIAKEKSHKFSKEDFETAPDKGLSAVSKSWYYGYKLHSASSIMVVFSTMGLTKASVRYIQYLNEVKHSEIINCSLPQIRRTSQTFSNLTHLIPDKSG